MRNVLKHCPKSGINCHKLTACCLLPCSVFAPTHHNVPSEGYSWMSFPEDYSSPFLLAIIRLFVLVFTFDVLLTTIGVRSKRLRWALLILPCRLGNSGQIRTLKAAPGWMRNISPCASARCVALWQSPATQARYLGHGFIETYDHRSKTPLLVLALLSKLVTIYHQQSLIRVCGRRRLNWTKGW